MDTFFKWLDYPDIGEHVGFFALQDGNDELLWHGKYELYYRSTLEYAPDHEADFIFDFRDFRVPSDEDAESYLRDKCDEDAPAVPVGIEDKWRMDADLCEIAAEYRRTDKPLREILAEWEGGILADAYDDYAEFARANHWDFELD